MVLYASDLDRTLIFSGKFLEDNPSDAERIIVETKNDRVISYMASSVADKLHQIKDNSNITFIPVTTRSISEYKRVRLGFMPEYAVTSNGGTILFKGKPMLEWENYIKKNLNMVEMMDMIQDIHDDIHCLDGEVKCIDGCYLFFKTNNTILYDIESEYLVEKYPNWDFTRQRNKCYAIPKHFSKQIALRWLWNKLGKPYIVASGDSELDLPMLTLANKAVIPKHGSLVSDGFVEDGTFADGGITSPLFTMNLVEEIAKNKDI